MDWKKIITEIYDECRALEPSGSVASYIPALAEVNPDSYGIAVATPHGEIFGVGDFDVKFSIQSISKVFSLSMVYPVIGASLWESVGREPSGNPFNSLTQLETEHGKPRNPFINAGALVITDRLLSLEERPKDALIDFVRSAANSDDIYFDKKVAKSEIEHSNRNMALGYFMKSFGNIHNDVEAVVDVYSHQCSISMSCRELATSFLFLACHGENPFTRQRIMTKSQSKRLNAIMLTCGFYDESGDFAFRVGLPGKSGVGGGIAAIIPGKASVAVWSPRLNKYGNSVLGIETLERLTTRIGNSIF
ncbi:MAG: glutaminase [Muribaculaceae bacterium]|nr:glutaminase [Muribaculaceae bacterium]